MSTIKRSDFNQRYLEIYDEVSNLAKENFGLMIIMDLKYMSNDTVNNQQRCWQYNRRKNPKNPIQDIDEESIVNIHHLPEYIIQTLFNIRVYDCTATDYTLAEYSIID